MADYLSTAATTFESADRDLANALKKKGSPTRICHRDLDRHHLTVTEVHQRPAGLDRTTEGAARQAHTDQVLVGHALRREQRALPVLAHLDLPSAETAADVLSVASQDNCPRQRV